MTARLRLCLSAAVWISLGAAARPADLPEAVRTEVADVIRDPRQEYVVLLRDPVARRVLPIWIGECEAMAIARKLRGRTFPRPLTHDLLRSVIEAAGCRLDSIFVDELRPLEASSESGTYFAQLKLVRPDGTGVRVDARPSDAIALGVRLDLPVHVAASIFQHASLPEAGGSAPPASVPDRPTDYY